MTRKKHDRHDQVEDAGTEPTADPAPAASDQAESAGESEQPAAAEDRVAELERALADAEARNLRVMADFQNFRRRNEEQLAERTRFAAQELVTALLPALDNLERALDAAQDAGSYESLHAGVELTRKQILDILKGYGVEPIEAVGAQFDPNLHDAVMRVEDPEAEENSVVEELRRGYTMHSRVIRPAMVKVSAKP